MKGVIWSVIKYCIEGSGRFGYREGLRISIYLFSFAMLFTRVVSKDCSMVFNFDWLNMGSFSGLLDRCGFL